MKIEKIVSEEDALERRIALAIRLMRQEGSDKIIDDALGDHYVVTLLYGYIRSFVRLAQLGDVSAVASELDTTRQTVGNHIHQLENLLQCRLFLSIDKHSMLTDRGADWLARAEEIYDLSIAFVSGSKEKPTNYKCSHLPLRLLLSPKGDAALRGFATAWMKSDKSITSPEFDPYRSGWIIYRRREGRWYADDIGPESVYADWFGWEDAKASIGRSVPSMAGGADLRDELSFQLDSVYTKGGIHYSEVACKLRKKATGVHHPVAYGRLLAEQFESDGSVSIASFIRYLDQPQQD